MKEMPRQETVENCLLSCLSLNILSSPGQCDRQAGEPEAAEVPGVSQRLHERHRDC